MERPNQTAGCTVANHPSDGKSGNGVNNEEAIAKINAAWNNRFEALKVLTLSLLNQIEALDQESDNPTALSFSDHVRQFESELIRAALIQTSGGQRSAARLLGMDATTLHRKIKRYGLDSNHVLSSGTLQ
jgi:transcriptional regulator with GAF, ATPase, and Fis domain